jgi:hypothetical protein
MENCHKTCQKTIPTTSEEEGGKKEEYSIFSCECGRKKHEIENKGDSAVPSDKKCCLLDLDIKIRNKMYYWCSNCNINVLCFICYSYCHNNAKCKGMRKKKDKLENLNVAEMDLFTVYDSPNKNKKCECNNAFHSSIISINTYINFLLANPVRMEITISKLSF